MPNKDLIWLFILWDQIELWIRDLIWKMTSLLPLPLYLLHMRRCGQRQPMRQVKYCTSMGQMLRIKQIYQFFFFFWRTRVGSSYLSVFISASPNSAILTSAVASYQGIRQAFYFFIGIYFKNFNFSELWIMFFFVIIFVFICTLLYNSIVSFLCFFNVWHML